MQITENFWFCKGADSNGITVSPLQSSSNFGNLEDLEYFQKKLIKSLGIPLRRYFNTDNALINNAENGILTDEINFAKFIIKLHNKFAAALKKGAITHLKYSGYWDQLHLSEDMIQISFTPPTEYLIYRQSKFLELRLGMLKEAVGADNIADLFSTKIALKTFMGWDDEQIKENEEQRNIERIKTAKEKYLLENIEKNRSADRFFY